MQNAEVLARAAAEELRMNRSSRGHTRALANHLNEKTQSPKWGGEGFDEERWERIAKKMRVRLHEKSELVLWAAGMKGYVALAALGAGLSSNDDLVRTAIRFCEAIVATESSG